MFIFPDTATARSHSVRSRRILLIALLLLVPLSSARAQGGFGDRSGISTTGGSHTIQGRLYFPTAPRGGTRVKVRMESTNSGAVTTVTDQDGSFRFNNVAAGYYTLTAEVGEEFEPVIERIDIDPARSDGGARVPTNRTVPIYVRLKGTGPTSANVLLANVPKPAAELYAKATESARKGDSKKAVEHLTAAIALHPNFGLALNELGVQYLKLGQADKAAEALRSALKITPDDFAPRLNYGFALLNKKEYAEAEVQLRQALKKNDASPTAHMYLGMALLSQRKNDEAEAELQRVVTLGKAEVGMAHRYLGGLYWSKRDYKRAADELEKYLELTPKAPDAEKLRGTIKELRSKQ